MDNQSKIQVDSAVDSPINRALCPSANNVNEIYKNKQDNGNI
jgi:hypothetical protein